MYHHNRSVSDDSVPADVLDGEVAVVDAALEGEALGCNSIDILKFGLETGYQTGPHSGPGSALGHFKFTHV